MLPILSESSELSLLPELPVLFESPVPPRGLFESPVLPCVSLELPVLSCVLLELPIEILIQLVQLDTRLTFTLSERFSENW